MVEAVEVVAYAVTCVAGVVASVATLARRPRPRLAAIGALADRWFLSLLACGAAIGLAGEVLFDPPGGTLDALVRGGAFGITGWALQALAAGRSAHASQEPLHPLAAALCVAPLGLAALAS